MNLPASDWADPISGETTSRAFDLLDEGVRRWVWEQRWNALRDVQEQAIPAILAGEQDVLLSAATASGKTEAAFLPICTRIVQANLPGLQTVYIAPLKALINDQFRRLDLLCERLEIPVHRWHGDVDAGRKRNLLKNPSGILLITPESLEAMFVRQGTKLPGFLGTIRYMVIDELHSFLGGERGKQLQSLLSRMETMIRRRVPRIALSATLSDLPAAAEFLRPGAGSECLIIRSASEGQELRAQIRGYRCLIPKTADGGFVETDEESTTEDVYGDGKVEIAQHLFKTLRDGHNLIFANARTEVEAFTDLFARLAEFERVPNPFFPHHGNLSREIREETESRLKDASRPATAVCTSTLEMGIDIGDMNGIAQVGVPPTVASLRQRVGRSGRRDEPARLRMYTREMEITPNTPLQDALRLETVQVSVMLELMIEGWNEPPSATAYHFSTLVQQTLSVLAQYGGMTALPLYKMLCKNGAFGNVDQKTFIEFLQSLHAADLVQQMDDGTLLVGLVGERLVNNYTFYAAFNTPDEYRLIAEGKSLGTLPVENPLIPESYIVYAGRRWKILDVDEAQKVVNLVPARGGRPPAFGGGGVWVDSRVRSRMFDFYGREDMPIFLDRSAQELVHEGRSEFLRFSLDSRRIVPNGAGTLLFLWTGDREAQTISLALHAQEIKTNGDGVCLSLDETSASETQTALRNLHQHGLPSAIALAASVPNKATEKHDAYLSSSLLTKEYAARFLDTDGANRVISRLLNTGLI